MTETGNHLDFKSRFSRGKSSADVGEDSLENLSWIRRLELERGDGAERNGDVSAELINSDGLLSTRLFERQRVVTSVFIEGRCPHLCDGEELSRFDTLISTEQSSIQ